MGYDHLAPICTLGRYVEREGRVLLPLTVQIHHTTADGFHTARLVDELEALTADPSWVDRAASAAKLGQAGLRPGGTGAAGAMRAGRHGGGRGVTLQACVAGGVTPPGSPA
ncbi:CatA-like O-acetyltransferase [Streptomyces halstedii]|uniref:CatA-like O-acetyltransferase n=2 Tax=Streptomyces TaxID=1883 RepID=UPI0037D22B75